MVTVEQTGQAEAGDPFRDPPPPLPYPPQFQQQPFGGTTTGPPPGANNQNIPIQSQTQASYPIPHPPAAAPQQVPMNTGAFNLQPMQDALPTDNNPYRKLHSQRTGQSEGSYPGPQSYLSGSLGQQHTGSYDHSTLQPNVTGQPTLAGYTPPPSSYQAPPAHLRTHSSSSVGSGAGTHPVGYTQPVHSGVFEMESVKKPAGDPFIDESAKAAAPTAGVGEWWESPNSSPTPGRPTLSLEEQLENEFHRGRGAIASASALQSPQPQQQQPQPSPGQFQPPAQIPPFQQHVSYGQGQIGPGQAPAAQYAQTLPAQQLSGASDPFVAPIPNHPSPPPKTLQTQEQHSLLDAEITSGGPSSGAQSAPAAQDTAQSSKPGMVPSIPLETYHVKRVRVYNPETNEMKEASILMQNENGPCPLIGLVNVLSVARVTLVVAEALRVRETISLELLLNVVCEELVLTNSYEGDFSELFNFLLGLRKGMNVNPKFVGDEITAEDFLRAENVLQNRALPQPKPGDFERTKELDLYAAFKIPLVHGWLPAPTSPMFPVLVQHARDFEKAQDIIIQQQFVLERSSKGEVISAEDSEIAAKGHEIQEFLESTGTQMTAYGLNILQTKLRPGSWSIFFRNDHFSALYKHARTGELYTLVTDSGYATYDEIVWESLVDSTGHGGGFFSGDFRPVGNGHGEASAVSQRQSDNVLDPNRGDGGWQVVQNRTSSRGQTGSNAGAPRRQVQSLIPPETGSQQPIVPPDTTGDTTDYDLALALHLQQEEEERANRIAANRVNYHPSQVTDLTTRQNQVRSLVNPAQGVGGQPRDRTPQQPPRPTGQRAQELRQSATNARRSDNEEIPPPYAPADPNPTAFTPGITHRSSFPTQGMGSFSRGTGSAYAQMSNVHNSGAGSSSSQYPGNTRGRRASGMGTTGPGSNTSGNSANIQEEEKKCTIM